MKKILFTLALLLLIAPSAYSHDSVAINNAYIRPTTSKSTAIYMEITNNSDKDEVLTQAFLPTISALVEIHKTVIDNGVAQMVPLQNLIIPAKKTVFLAPKGIHIMVMGLQQPLIQGQTVTLKLHFQNAGAIELTVPISKTGANV